MYINHMTGEQIVSCPDSNAGLYVIDRRNKNNNHQTNERILKVDIPYDCCAIQIGECVQIITGGVLCATPHCVRGCTTNNNDTTSNIARISLPCFIDTHPSFPLVPPMGISRQQVLMADSFCHNKVPPLALRWKTNATNHNNDTTTTDNNNNEPMTFGEFLHETFHMYYGWGSES
jgi:isopenicillin N synthase-like dioxygenase